MAKYSAAAAPGLLFMREEVQQCSSFSWWSHSSANQEVAVQISMPNLCPLANSAVTSTPAVHCRWEDEAARIGLATRSAETEKIKSLTIRIPVAACFTASFSISAIEFKEWTYTYILEFWTLLISDGDHTQGRPSPKAKDAFPPIWGFPSISEHLSGSILPLFWPWCIFASCNTRTGRLW